MSMSVTDSYTQSQTRLQTSVTELNVATAHWRRNAANAHLAAPGMLLTLPYLGPTITWTARGCSQGRCNEVMGPRGLWRRRAEVALRPPAPAIQMAVDVAPASLMLRPTARIYIRGASLGHASLGRTAHPPVRGLTRVPSV